MDDFIKKFEFNCSKVQKKTFKKGEIITTYIAKKNQICILVSGEAELVRYDYDGSKTIIEHFNKNDIFGEMFYIVTANNELTVEAKQKCTVLFFVYDNLKHCRNNCEFHKNLSDNISDLILRKITSLNSRVELLTKRSIRDKLLGYFSILSSRNFSKSFTLPFSLTDLADYLGVDRSAMMREIKALKEDGILEKNGNLVTLLYK